MIIRWLAPRAALVACLLCGGVLRADTTATVDIVVPELAAPFDRLAELMVEGIQSVLPQTRVLTPEEVPQARPIVLTRRYWSASRSDAQTVVAGLGEFTTEDNVYAVSINISPTRMLETVRLVDEQVDRIVFFDAFDRARTAVDDLTGLTSPQVEYCSAVDTIGALRCVARHEDQASSETVFAFLSGFLELDVDTILPLVTRRAWELRVLTIATRAGFVREGISLGALPDFRGYGRQIAELWLAAREEEFARPRVELLDTIATAINVRSARRSGVLVTEQLIDAFDASYPARR